MTDDLAARRARHRAVRRDYMVNDTFIADYCVSCHVPWPCDAAVLGDALQDEEQARQAAEAAVARLREQVRFLGG